LYNMTQDDGVRRMLSFLLARDTMHQNQWLAAIRELEEDGLESTPVPSAFPQELEKTDVSYLYVAGSEGGVSTTGRWASGVSADGRGEITAVRLEPLTDDDGLLAPVDPRTYGTPPAPVPAKAAE
ncbi:manganese catalase family protein, partial [Hansschlegelia sp.]|uniref:manganese catalase family protein n=1 Tax=Hansschlegelia sp. TaxID=2041892 RepID=UPI002B9BA38D